MTGSYCVEDVHGYIEPGHFPTAFWADYDFEARTLFFGGDWADIPPMPSETCPTAHMAHSWVKNHRRRAR